MTDQLGTTAFLFPGQGSQNVGMGHELADRFDTAKAFIQKANQVLGFDLGKLCFEGPEEDLRQTENTQPALYVVSCATLEVIREQGVPVPGAVAGHSLGEYSALYAAGVFDFETGLRLVRARGEAMRNAGKDRPGAMAAVLGLDGGKVADICNAVSEGEGIVVAANFNAPDQTVISGDPRAIEDASKKLSEAGAKRVVPLPVSGAFHSPLVQPASDIMKAKLEAATFVAPRGVQFYNNADAKALVDPAAIRDSLVRQVISPVRWVETIETLWNLGTRRFVEVGSGKVLSGLVRRMHRDAEVLTTESVDALQSTINTLKNA